MNVHFDTFEEDFGYTIKEYIKRGEGYFSAKNLGDLTYEDLLTACRQYIETLEEELIEQEMDWSLSIAETCISMWTIQCKNLTEVGPP